VVAAIKPWVLPDRKKKEKFYSPSFYLLELVALDGKIGYYLTGGY